MAKYQRSIQIGVVLLAVFLAYSNHFQNGFHFDDFHTITDNVYIRDLHNIPKFFTDASTFSVLATNRTYRPVISASLALDYRLGHGYKPFWFHLSTFLWFLLQLGAMYSLFKTIMDVVRPQLPNWRIALLATAAYGLHPVNAETINYIIQRGDVYSTLGVVAGLASFARFPQWRKTGLYLLPVIFAVMSKPPALVFPILLFFYILYFEPRTGRRATAALIECIPAFAVIILSAWLQAAMTPKTYLPGIVSAYSYRITQPYVWLRYFGSFFLPIHLSADTDLQPFAALNADALLGLLFTAALVATIWITARTRAFHPISFGLVWFVIALIPTSVYPLSEVENDHRMYFAFVGLTLAVTWALALAAERLRSPALQRAVLPAALVALAAFGIGTWRRNQVWRTEESLWQDVVEKSPKNGRGLMNYGLTQMAKGNIAGSLDLFQRALPFTPNYPALEINLGVANGALHRAGEAEAHFRRAMSLAAGDCQPFFYYGRWLKENGRLAEAIPMLRISVALNPSWLESRKLLMNTYSESGADAEAVQEARETLKLAPGDADALRLLAPIHRTADDWVNVSLRQYQQHQYEQAIASARQALKEDPKSFLAYNNIGATYAELGQWDLAIENIKEALRINPAFEVGRNNLTLYSQRKQNAHTPVTPEAFLEESLRYHQAAKYPESIAAAKSALKLRPNFAEAYNNIAAAYEAMGKWDEAIAAARQALRLNPQYQLAKNNLAWAEDQKKRLAK